MSWPKARLTLQRSPIARTDGRCSSLCVHQIAVIQVRIGARNRPWPQRCRSLPHAAEPGFRPLHASNGYGSNVSEKMAAVDVAPIPGRVGQQIRNELIYQTTGGGEKEAQVVPARNRYPRNSFLHPHPENGRVKEPSLQYRRILQARKPCRQEGRSRRQELRSRRLRALSNPSSPTSEPAVMPRIALQLASARN